MKTFSIKTFGCKVNQYDSQSIRADLFAGGFNESDSPEIYIVNTCCVTGHAEAKCRRYINQVRRRYPDSILVVTGCSVDYSPESFRHASYLVPNSNKNSITDILGGGCGRKAAGIADFSNHTRAFVKIQDGCGQCCSYCIVPYVRGGPRSRDFDDVLHEIERLSSAGYKEIVLTGIHLGKYDRFEELIGRIERIEKLSRVRLSSIEPQDFSDGFIDAICKSTKICRHFHIPLQSGSDRILKMMNRGYTYSEYKELTRKITAGIPEVVFTTDIIAGFPGETEEDFILSCESVDEIGFSKVHIFPYSDRKGTKASGFSDKVAQEEIRSRVIRLKNISDTVAERIRKTMIGTIQQVLIENDGRRISGYTSKYMPVKIKEKIVVNELVNVKITGQSRHWSDGGQSRHWSDGGQSRHWSDGGQARMPASLTSGYLIGEIILD